MLWGQDGSVVEVGYNLSRGIDILGQGKILLQIICCKFEIRMK